MSEKGRQIALLEGIVAGALFGTAALFVRLTDMNVFTIAHILYFFSLSNLKSFETAAMALLEPIGRLF